MQAENVNGDDLRNLDQFMNAHLAGFRPIAYYDKHLDCVRVQILDCSVTEHRLSTMFTILEANHSDMPDAIVGFTIKGVRHLCEEVGIDTKGVVRLVEIIDKIVRSYPHEAMLAVEEFVVSSVDKEMTIDFSEASKAA